jgi:protein SCO1/2
MRNREPAVQTGNSIVAITAVLLLIVAAGLLLRAIISTPELPLDATVLPAPAPLAEFTLADHDEQPFTKESFRGHWSLVFFGFTNCPDICPITLHQLATARNRFAKANPDSALPDIVFISVDPDRDSSEALKQYAQSFGEGVTGVRGDPVELSKLAKPMGIYYEVEESDEQNYNVAHSAAVIVVNERAEFHALFSAPHDIDAIANDMRIIIASK